jgi:hypothetical protein
MIGAGRAPTATPPSGGPPLPYCERCGNLVGAVSTLMRVVLRMCPSCRVYACDRCWAGAAGACPGCGVKAGDPTVLIDAVAVLKAAARHAPAVTHAPAVAERSTEMAAKTAFGDTARPDRFAEPEPDQGRQARARRTPFAVGIALVAIAALAFVAVVPLRPSGAVEGILATAPTITDGTATDSESPVLPSLSGNVAAGSQVPPAISSPGTVAGLPMPSVAPATPSASPAISPGPSGGGPRETSRAQTPTPWPTASARPATAVSGAWFRGWSDPTSVTRGQVLSVVQNRSSSWITFPTGASRYSILDDAGRRSASGAFAYAFPQRLEPGGRAYLVDMIDASFANLTALKEVTVEPIVEASEPVTDVLVVTDVTWGKANGGGLTASGRLTNRGSAEVRGVLVAIVFLDTAGNPLALTYDPEPRTLGPNESRAFTTAYPNTGPLDPAQVFQVESIAAPFQP